jgi:hypothetical protein
MQVSNSPQALKNCTLLGCKAAGDQVLAVIGLQCAPDARKVSICWLSSLVAACTASAPPDIVTSAPDLLTLTLAPSNKHMTHMVKVGSAA